MKFTESKNYLDYMNAISSNDYPAARLALFACVNQPEFINNPIQHSYLLQLIGQVFFAEGDKERALQYYSESENVDKEGFLAKLEFAKFLARGVCDKSAAISKCQKIIADVSSKPFPESEDDFSSDWYIQNAQMIIDELQE